jgi:hypothetical protein
MRGEAAHASVARLVLFDRILHLSALAGSGLDGRFYLSKESYAAGEPVYLIFEVRNSRTQPLNIRTANPFSFCGGYTIEVDGSKNQKHLGCFEGKGGSVPEQR